MNKSDLSAYRKVWVFIVTLALLLTGAIALVLIRDQQAVGASVIGEISVTGGSTRTYTGVNYLLDGSITVSGSGSRLTFINSTISLSQDVGSDGSLGGGDDHIYTISVSSGAVLEFKNSVLTTQTDQLHPYFNIQITVDGSVSQLSLVDSIIEGPGSITFTNGARFIMDGSVLKELTDKSNLGYDIDGDGSTEDDRDFNDDGPLLTMRSGSRGTVIDSQVRDTLSFSVSQRDGFQAGNITLMGTSTNLTVINSFLDIDMENSLSTGSHNMLKVENGAVAHLAGASINTTSPQRSGAITIPTTAGKVVYYRWIAAHVLDGMGIQVENVGVKVLRVEGTTNRELTNSFLTSELLQYMGRGTTTWNRTDEQGWAFIPVITDLFTYGTMPNSDVTPDFKVNVIIGSETMTASASFPSYPSLPSYGDETDLFSRFKASETISSKIGTNLGGPIKFSLFVAQPSTSSFFNELDLDLTVTSKTLIKGTSALVDGVFYPSYYAFDGHLMVTTGGELIMNDTTVKFLTGDGPAYILVENGGKLALNNVSLSGLGAEKVYIYIIGTGSPSITVKDGEVVVDHIVARNGANFWMEGSNFNGSLNLYGSSVHAYISAAKASIPSLYARNCQLNLSEGAVSIGKMDWKGVSFGSTDATLDITLDVDNRADLLNTTFTGTLPSGRSYWLKATGTGLITESYWAKARVEDTVGNPLPGSVISIDRVDGSSTLPIGAYTTDEAGEEVFPLLQDEIRSTGSKYMGNYRLKASFRTYTSEPYSAAVDGAGVDAVIRIPGGPNVIPNFLKVEGALIADNPVLVEANISNIGRFDAGPFAVTLLVDGLVVGEKMMDGLGSGSYASIMFEWTAQAGDVEFSLVVDAENVMRELGEDDNVLNQSNVIGFGPDYSVSIEMTTKEWVFGVQGEFDVVITNVGEPDPSETPFVLDVTYQGGLGSGPVVSGMPVDYIPPGMSVTQNIIWVPPVIGQVILRAVATARFDRSPINSIDTELVMVKTLPDIKVVEGSFEIGSPIPVTVNTTATLSLDLTNGGEMPTGSFGVALYDGEIDNKTLIETITYFEDLLPGGMVTVEVVWFAGGLGTHDIIVVLDIANDVMEQNETNNIVHYPVMVDTPPDLTFSTNIGLFPSVVTEGKNITFYATVRNAGKTMAKNADVQFSVDSDTNVIATKTVSLYPGQLINVSATWTVSGPGLHTMYVDLDPKDRIIEPIEINNHVSAAFRVISKPDIYMGKNDLRVIDQGLLDIGKEVRFNATIRNSGETDARNVFIRFYDGDPETGGKIISWKESQPSVPFEVLPAGGSRYAEFVWIPTTGGYHNIYAVMDLSNFVEESDETNNKAFWTVYVQTLPDLALTNIIFLQGPFTIGSAGVGSSLIINLTLENKGDSPSPEFQLTFRNGEYLNDPLASMIGGVNTYLAGSILGHSKTYINMPWTVDYPKGIRNIFAVVEPLNGAQEQSLLNNMVGGAFEIFDIEDVPELTLEETSLKLGSAYEGMSPDEIGIGFVGMNLTVVVNVSNLGGKAAGNSSLVFMVSNGTATWEEFRTRLDFIENNATEVISGFWELNSIGENTLSVIVDPENGIREFDESNNVLVRTLSVAEAPDLIVTLRKESEGYDPQSSEFHLVKGKEYRVSFMVENTGNYTYSGLEVRFTGQATQSKQYITVGPYAKQIVFFNVKPLSSYDQPVVWKCKANEGRTVYESDFKNNEASGLFSVKEPEKGPNILLLVIAVIIVLLIILGVIAFFVYKRYQQVDKAKCSNCGGLVDLDAKVCPHCGIEFSDELECECGAIIPPGAVECPSCHKPIKGEVETEVEGEEKEGEPEEEQGEEVEGKKGEEEKKAQPPEPVEEMEELGEEEAAKPAGTDEELAECFECGALIPVSAPICPHCGAVFE